MISLDRRINGVALRNGILAYAWMQIGIFVVTLRMDVDLA